MECSDQLKIYKMRKWQETFLWKYSNHRFVDFEQRQAELFQHQYGFYRQSSMLDGGDSKLFAQIMYT